MGDGWETRRRREPGNDWCIVKLGHVAVIERIEVDTAHFKGTIPTVFPYRLHLLAREPISLL
jgi:allantoicase